MKKNIFLYEKNEYFKVEKLIKCNNGDAFFKTVNLMKNKEKEIIEIDINTLHCKNNVSRNLTLICVDEFGHNISQIPTQYVRIIFLRQFISRKTQVCVKKLKI